jgi:glycogen debranching enzyme GlgX
LIFGTNAAAPGLLSAAPGTSLHEAGIEVILDVVYNHTAEGNHLGPVLSFKGIDNRAYYRLADGGHFYFDTTGTGNTLNMRHPHVLQLIIDSLRYWVARCTWTVFASTWRPAWPASSTRSTGCPRSSTSFQVDPVRSQVKLIAEPWDLGEGGYQVGNFPTLWSEWNGRYRDTARDYGRGEDRTLADFGYRLTGSSDLYGPTGRRPYASVNFVTAHDGFTLADLVAYNGKHNEANGEGNRDGTDDNRSWNSGAEAPDPGRDRELPYPQPPARPIPDLHRQRPRALTRVSGRDLRIRLRPGNSLHAHDIPDPAAGTRGKSDRRPDHDRDDDPEPASRSACRELATGIM